MLIEFSIGNVLSFNDIQHLNMTAGNYRNNSARIKKHGKLKLVKFMSIYGANASGKSNLISALGFFQSIVVDSFKYGSYNLYCRTDDKNKDKPSFWEIKILIDGKVFVYGFKAILSQSVFIEEWLYEESQSGSRKYVFTRDTEKGSFSLGDYISSKRLSDRVMLYGEDIRTDKSILFLNAMNQNKASLYEKNPRLGVFKQVFIWIKYKLDVNSAENPVTNYSVLNTPEGIEKITQKLLEFDTGIEKFNIIPVSQEAITSRIPNDTIKEIQKRLIDQKSQHPNLPKDFKPTVLIKMSDGGNMYIIELGEDGNFEFKTMIFTHKNSSNAFSLEDESDGTIRLLDIIEVLLTNSEDKVYVIDEINRKFHPLLTQKFVSDFLKLAEERNIQLIVTTHESQLMDLKLLRQDEISFINKDETGHSKVYSLIDYDVRFDKKVVVEYLRGKYDAIPIWRHTNNE